MSTSLAAKRAPEASAGVKSEIILIFYLLTLLAGGFFLFVGGKLGFVVNLTAAVSYVAVMVLFYRLSKGA